MQPREMNPRQAGRALGLGPSLLLAVTLIVLTSGGLSTARLIGSASVGLALTVLPERAARATAEPAELAEPGAALAMTEGAAVKARGPELGALAASAMARLGLGGLPPPAQA